MIFDFNELAGGAVKEKFDQAITEVLENMQDPNTAAKCKRAVTIKLTFDQNEQRTESQLDVDVTTKLAPHGGVSTRIGIDKDLRTGEVFAAEYRPLSARQIGMDDVNRTFDVTEDGEVIRETTGEQTENRIVKFERKVK